jgi:hypothetical protein
VQLVVAARTDREQFVELGQLDTAERDRMTMMNRELIAGGATTLATPSCSLARLIA